MISLTIVQRTKQVNKMMGFKRFILSPSNSWFFSSQRILLISYTSQIHHIYVVHYLTGKDESKAYMFQQVPQ